MSEVRCISDKPARVAGLFIFVLCSTAASAQDTDLAIVSQTADAGDFISIELRIETAPNEASAIGLDVVYDSELLRFTDSFARGELIAGFTLVDVAEVAPGRVRLAAITVGEPVTIGASGGLVTIDFEVLACPDAETVLAFDMLVDDVAGWVTTPGGVMCPLPILNLSDRDVFIDARAGSVAVEVQNIGSATLNWTATVIEGNDWLSLSTGSGTGGEFFNAQYAANGSGVSRTGFVRVQSNGDMQMLRVVQGAAQVEGEPGLAIDALRTGSEVTATIHVRRAPSDAVGFGFDVLYDAARLSYAGEFDPGELVESFQAFTAVEVRPGLIRVAAAAGGAQITRGETGELVTLDFTVTECPESETVLFFEALVDDIATWQIFPAGITCGPAMLRVTPDELRVGAAQGSATLQIERAGDGTSTWQADTPLGGSWLSVTPNAGTDDATLTVNYLANTSTQQRTGQIRITTPEPDGQVILVDVVQNASPSGPGNGMGCAAQFNDSNTTPISDALWYTFVLLMVLRVLSPALMRKLQALAES